MDDAPGHDPAGLLIHRPDIFADNGPALSVDGTNASGVGVNTGIGTRTRLVVAGNPTLVSAGGPAVNILDTTLADAARLDRSYMSGIERGVRNITLLKLFAVARALKVSARELLPDD